MMASVQDKVFVLGFSFTHSTAQCTGEHGCNAAPYKQPNTHIHPTVINTVTRPAKARKCLDVHMREQEEQPNSFTSLSAHAVPPRHQKGNGSCFKSFSCSSPAFSLYKPPAYQCSSCLWPRRGSGVSLITCSLKAVSSNAQANVGGQTQLYWIASELMEQKENMIVTHKAPGTVWEVLCSFCFLCTLAIPGQPWKMHAGGMVGNVNREIKAIGMLLKGMLVW